MILLQTVLTWILFIFLVIAVLHLVQYVDMEDNGNLLLYELDNWENMDEICRWKCMFTYANREWAPPVLEMTTGESIQVGSGDPWQPVVSLPYADVMVWWALGSSLPSTLPPMWSQQNELFLKSHVQLGEWFRKMRNLWRPKWTLTSAYDVWWGKPGEWGPKRRSCGGRTYLVVGGNEDAVIRFRGRRRRDEVPPEFVLGAGTWIHIPPWVEYEVECVTVGTYVVSFEFETYWSWGVQWMAKGVETTMEKLKWVGDTM